MNSERLTLGIVLVALIAVYTAVLFGFLNTTGDTRLFYLGLIGLPLGIIFFMLPKFALTVLGALIYSLDWISEAFNAIPREATWLIDILVILLLGRTALFAMTRKGKMPAVEKLIYAFLAFAILSALLNGLSKVTMFVGFRVGFRYLGLFLAAYYLAPNQNWFRGYIRFLFAIALIQIPIILWQLSYFGWSDPDQLSGTFGLSQTTGVALFLLVLMTYMVSRAMEERRIHPTHIFIGVLFVIAPILGEVKFFFMLLPLLMIFMTRREFFKRPALSIGMVAFGLLMVVAVDFVIVSSGGWAEGRNPLSYIQKLPEVFSSELEQKDEERFERSFLYANAIRLASGSPREIVLGNGPGSITQSVVSEGHSAKAAYFEQWGLSSNATTIPWLLIEYGFVGTAVILLILYLIFRRGRVLRQSATLEIRVYGRTLETITFLYICWLFYSPAWQSDSMNFIYWPLSGFLVYFSYQSNLVAVTKPVEQDHSQPTVEPRTLPAMANVSAFNK